MWTHEQHTGVLCDVSQLPGTVRHCLPVATNNTLLACCHCLQGQMKDFVKEMAFFTASLVHLGPWKYGQFACTFKIYALCCRLHMSLFYRRRPTPIFLQYNDLSEIALVYFALRSFSPAQSRIGALHILWQPCSDFITIIFSRSLWRPFVGFNDI